MSIADKYTTLTTEKIPKVYEAGYEKGKSEGGDPTAAYDQGVADGKKSEYDAFWDAFQQNGTRTSYETAFQDWQGSCFKPKHNLQLVGNYATSQSFRRANGFDLKAMTTDRGVAFDTSQATRMNSTFIQSGIGNIPPLDLSSCTSLAQTFMSLQSGYYATKEIILNNLRESCAFDRTFEGAKYIERLMITGTIGQNGFNVKDCTKLSKASITSIVNALSPSTSGLTVTLSKTAVESAFVTTEGEAEISISSKQSDGFYIVTFGSAQDTNSLLKFTVPMDISVYGVVGVDGEEFEADISKNGVYNLGVWEEVTATAPSGSTFTCDLGAWLSYGGTLKIKRTDGKDLSSGDVSAYMRGDYSYEWLEMIAEKPNWNIILV